MKYYALILYLFLFIISSCENKQVDSQQTLSNDRINKTDSILLHPSSRDLNIENSSNQVKESNDYKFSGKDLCNDHNGFPIKFITEEDINNNGIRKVFDFQKNEEKDSVFISFKMISDCCQSPKDSLVISEREIKLFPSFKSSSVCDCYCDYLFEYKLSKKFINNRKILTENN